MKRAVRVKPYIVCEMKHTDVLNFDDLNSHLVKGNTSSRIQLIHNIVYKKVASVVKASFANEIGDSLKEKSYLQKQCTNLSETVISNT